MPDIISSDLASVAARNDIRANAGLPLLAEDAELNRLHAVRDDAAFEAYFQQRRPQYAHLWQTNRGFITNMGIYAMVRKKLRDEMQRTEA